MSSIQVGDPETIDPDIFALEHRGREATVLEVREEVRQPSGSTFYHFRLDLRDSRSGEWNPGADLVLAEEAGRDMETILRRWRQRFAGLDDWEAMQAERMRGDDPFEAEEDDFDNLDLDDNWDYEVKYG